MFDEIAPIFPSRDLAATESFYAGLGFRTLSRLDDAGYLIVRRGRVEIHFFRAPDIDPAASNHAAYMRLADAAAWSEELRGLGLPGAGIPRAGPAEAKPWGMVEVAVVDPDGNLLRGGSPLVGETDG